LEPIFEGKGNKRGGRTLKKILNLPTVKRIAGESIQNEVNGHREQKPGCWNPAGK